MKFGNTKIGGMSFGSIRIGGAKYGNDLVFQSGPGIPDGPVDWIETDGVAYINSGIVGNAPKSVRAMVTFKAGASTMIGARSNSGDTRFVPIAIYQKILAYGFYYYTKGSIETAIDNGIPVIVEAAFKSGGQLFRHKACGDGSFAEYAGTTSGGIQTSKNMFVFAENGANGVVNKMPSGTRLHYLKIYSNYAMSSLVFDGIPYKNNGEYGLWDKVSNSFFGNAAASGKFKGGLYGNVPYTPVDYIQTDGVAYIDTGVLGNDPKSVELKFTPAGTSNNLQVVLGTTNGSENADTFMPVYLTTGGALGIGHYYFYSSGGLSVMDSINNHTPAIVKAAYKKSSQKLQVKQEGEPDFTSFSKTQSNEIASNAPMSLFAAHSPSNAAGVRKCISGTRLYYCKIYSNENFTDLIFDAVPCLYNGEYGLWDKVTNSFFGNVAESGAFSGPSNA